MWIFLETRQLEKKLQWGKQQPWTRVIDKFFGIGKVDWFKDPYLDGDIVTVIDYWGKQYPDLQDLDGLRGMEI